MFKRLFVVEIMMAPKQKENEKSNELFIEIVTTTVMTLL